MPESLLRYARRVSRGENSTLTIEAPDIHDAEELLRRDSSDARWPALLRLALVISVALLFGALACAVLATPDWSFNGTRLVPSFLLASGHRVLELPGHGPLYSTHYGPLTYVVYLPATLFDTPNAAVLAGSTITVLLCLLAVAWLHFGGERWRSDFWPALLGFTAAGYLICYLEPLRYSCVNIHADGPGIAFGGAACAILRRRDASTRPSAMIASAALAVMAALCKQPLALLAFGLLAYLYLAYGRKTALLYLKALCAAGLILGGLFVWAFGPRELYYHVSMATRHPWRIAGAAAIVQPVRTFVRHMFPVLLVATVAVVTSLDRRLWKTGGRRWMQANDWIMLFVVGIALLPSSVSGFAMIGADVNSLSFSSFFFTVGVTCALADLASRHSYREVRQLARRCLLAVALLLMIIELPVALPGRVASLKTAEQQVVFDYIRNHERMTFFPWFPLSHLLAEGRFYHWTYGIVDRVLAGDQISPDYFRAYAPAGMNRIAFGKDGAREILGIDLLSFWGSRNICAVADPALESWEVYRSSPNACDVVTSADARRAVRPREQERSSRIPPANTDSAAAPLVE
jgi:hypothetical protein